MVVMHGMPCSIAARRISQPSARAPRPTGVLITRSTSPPRMLSTTCGEPSPILFSFSTGTPIARIACAVPLVASTRKPRSCMRAASWVAAGLSVSQTLMNTLPSGGRATPGARLGLAEGGREVLARSPSPRPVDFISGPSSASEPWKRWNGSTASLTLTWRPPGSRGSSWSASALAEDQPAGHLRERHTDRLRDERHGARGARVRLDHVQAVVVHERELHVQEPDDAQPQRDRASSGGGSPRASPRRGSAAAARRPSRRSGRPPPRRAA